ncbi:fibronectin type III domain-containing protein [Roseiflexus castenholzii]|uniref:fibronectin type III domain-containing protein n=1 Tax=Roseiflexus castenholzii TaxID=120962 RepID=UPI003C7A3274
MYQPLSRPGCIALALALIVNATFVLLALPSVALASGSIVYVAPSGSDTPTCGSASQPCATLEAGLERIVHPATGRYAGEIRLAAGTYTYPSNRAVAFIWRRGVVTIRGGYSTGDWNTSNPTANVTILDGENVRRGIWMTNSTFDAAQCVVTIEGLTVTRGRARSDDPSGGGILNDSCTLTLRNVTITNSVARGQDNTNANPATSPGSGGGLSIRGVPGNPAVATLENVVISSNQAIGGNDSASASRGGLASGGGLFAINARVRAVHLRVENNIARAGDAPGSAGVTGGIQFADGLGGGIFFALMPLFELDRAQVLNNRAEGGDAGNQGGLGLGGGIKIELSAGSITNSVIRGNSAKGGAGANGGAGHGGGIFSTGSTVTIENVQVLQNSVQGVNGSTVGGNGGGGGIYLITTPGASSTVTASNIVIAGNSAQAGNGAAPTGGGLDCADTQLTLRHATIANNVLQGSVAGLGPSIRMVGTSSSAGCGGEISNSIIANHSGSPIYASSSIKPFTVARVLFFNNGSPNITVEGSAPVTEQNSFSGNPQFVSPDAPNFDYHIQAGSAARDQALNSTTAGDIDGQARPFGAASDVGADEYSTEIPLTFSRIPRGVTLSWRTPPVLPITQYRIEYTKSAGASDALEGLSPIMQPVSTTTLTLSGLTRGATYTIVVIGLNGGSEVGRSQEVTLTIWQHEVFLPLVVR